MGTHLSHCFQASSRPVDARSAQSRFIAQAVAIVARRNDFRRACVPINARIG